MNEKDSFSEGNWKIKDLVCSIKGQERASSTKGRNENEIACSPREGFVASKLIFHLVATSRLWSRDLVRTAVCGEICSEGFI